MFNQIDNVGTPQTWADVNTAIIEVSDTIMFHHVNEIHVLVQYRQ